MTPEDKRLFMEGLKEGKEGPLDEFFQKIADEAARVKDEM